MTVAFSTASQPINITLGLPSQRGGADGGRGGGEEGWGRKRWQQWDLRASYSPLRQKAALFDTQTYKNRHNIAWPQEHTQVHTPAQPDKYLLMGLNSSSIPRRKLLLSNKHIYSINSDSPHHRHKTKCQHSPASLSSCSLLSQNTPVNSTHTHPSSTATLRDPLLSKLAFPQSRPDSEKWCRQRHRGKLPVLTLCYTCETRVCF